MGNMTDKERESSMLKGILREKRTLGKLKWLIEALLCKLIRTFNIFPKMSKRVTDIIEKTRKLDQMPVSLKLE